MSQPQLLSGALIAVGVGPGDPGLVTRAGWQAIQNASVIAYPTLEDGPSFARSIVADAIAPDVVEIAMSVPMTLARKPAQDAYDKGADEIATHLREGRDVVVLCEGDALFYGSFMYVLARLRGQAAISIIPGVTSVTAVAAAALRPLVARNEVMTVLPGPLDDDSLRAHIAASDSLAIMKVGRHFTRLRALIDMMGLTQKSWFVSHASLPHEQSCALADAPDKAPYFSLILILKETDEWTG